jgi:hypothetical protein
VNFDEFIEQRISIAKESIEIGLNSSNILEWDENNSVDSLRKLIGNEKIMFLEIKDKTISLNLKNQICAVLE